MHIYFDKRESGLPLIGELPWGSHFCLFYQTDKDLLEIFVPFFKAGLDSNELCVWVNSDPQGNDYSTNFLRDAIPDFEKYASNGQMEIIPLNQYHVGNEENFDIIDSLLDKAICRGFDGLRLTCSASITEIQKVLFCPGANALSRSNALAAFAYPREKIDAIGIMEVVKRHRFALVKNGARWEVIESSEARTINDDLKRSEEKLQFLFRNMSEGFAYHRIVLDENRKPCDYVFLEVNESFEKLTSIKKEDILGKRVTEALPGIEKDPTDWIGKYGEVALTGKPMQFESYSESLNKWYSVSAFSPHKGYFAVTFIDITKRKQAEEERATTVEFLRLVNKSQGTADLIRGATSYFQQRSGCDAVGIRLRQGNDYPYYEVLGFSKEFVMLENHLCTRDKAGQPLLDGTGNPVLECMCGNVICGRFNPSKPFFTARGSFWTNCTTQLLASTTEADRQARTRNRCNGEGYESVALIALRSGDECLGLLQLNDRRKGLFSLEALEVWERLADHLSTALAKFRAEEEITRLASFPRLNPCPVFEINQSGEIVFFNEAAKSALERLGLSKCDLGQFIPQDNDEIFNALSNKLNKTFYREVNIKESVFAESIYIAPLFNAMRIYAMDITELKRAEQQFRILSETAGDLLAAERPQEIVDKLCMKVMSYLDCHVYFNFLVDANRGQLRLNAYAGIQPETAKEIEWLDFGVAVCGCAARDCVRIVCENIPHTPDPRTELVKSYGIKAYVCHPLLAREKLIGTLSFGTKSKPKFTDDEIALMKTVADQVAVALERIQTQEALIEREQRLNRSQEIAHLGSWELDIMSDRLYWSDEVYRIFGLKPQEFGATYEAFLESVHPDDRTAVDEAYSDSLREGRDSYGIEHRVVRKITGEIRIVHEKCEHFRDEIGRIVRSVGMVHDITDSKLLEQERERLLHELTRSNKELEQFAYIASHDLQEPLRMISSYVQLLSRRYKSKLDKDADEFIDYVVNGALHMQTLLNDLLAYSRVGTRNESFKLIDLKAILNRALIYLKVEIDKNMAEITSENLPVLYADEVQMVQVFQNLISNSIKFQANGTPRIHVSADHEGQEWIIKVRDNGIGIDPKYFNKLFAIFKRLHRREEYPGTGIGLAICKKIIDRHKGRIWIESEPGKGATFCFTIKKQTLSDGNNHEHTHS